MKTEAEAALDATNSAIKTAITSISRIVVEECEGSHDITDTYLSALRASLLDLLLIRRRLK